MDIKLVHTPIIDKKISSFARVVMEIFNFFFGKLTFAPPCTPSTNEMENINPNNEEEEQ
jgi:hypothetical protein